MKFPIELSASTKIAGDCHGCGKQDVLHCVVSAIHAAHDCPDCHGTGIVQGLHYPGCPNRNLLVRDWVDLRPTVRAMLSIVPDFVDDSHIQHATDLPIAV